MDKRFLEVLNSEEKSAVDVLEKCGWVFLADIEVYKATPDGERFPDYLQGGIYPIGILRRPGHKKPVALPTQTQKKKPKASKE